MPTAGSVPRRMRRGSSAHAAGVLGARTAGADRSAGPEERAAGVLGAGTAGADRSAGPEERAAVTSVAGQTEALAEPTADVAAEGSDATPVRGVSDPVSEAAADPREPQEIRDARPPSQGSVGLTDDHRRTAVAAAATMRPHSGITVDADRRAGSGEVRVPRRVSEMRGPERPPARTETGPAAPPGSGRGFRARLFRPRKRVRRPHHTSYWLVPLLILLALGLVFGGLALSGRSIGLPVWAVAEVEARLNRSLAEVRIGTTGRPSVSLGGADVRVDGDWVPRIRLADVRLIEGDGTTLLTLPDLRIALDPGAILRGQARLRSLRVMGAEVGLTRLADGRFDLAFGQGPMPVVGFAGLVGGLVDAFGQPALSSLHLIEAEGLTLTVRDRRANRTWVLDDGAVRLDNGVGEIRADIGVSLPSRATAQGSDRVAPAPAEAHLALVASKSDGSARLDIAVTSVAAADIAAQASPLAFLAVIDAPISGRFSSALDASGRLSGLDGALAIGQGALRPVATADPVEFDAGKLAFTYDPARERIELTDLTVESPSLRVAATGHADLPGAQAGFAREMLAQVRFSEVTVDPAGLFTEPARFDGGALDFRLRLVPFAVDIGQLSLTGGGSTILLGGDAEAGPKGWRTSVDVSLDRIARNRLLALWPPSAVPQTRAWVADNVQEGDLSNVHVAFRLAPGQEPRLSLGYDFAGADVTFLKTLPPVRNGFGYNTIEGRTYTLLVRHGQIAPPEGGMIDVAGSVLQVPDITARPARVEIDLRTAASLTATLSLLDQPPFNFLGKANLPVTLGDGTARLRTRLAIPLKQGLTVGDVAFAAAGDVKDLTSTDLIPGRTLRSDRLAIAVSPDGLSIAGPGTFDGVPFEGTYAQDFRARSEGAAQIEGTAELSPSAVEKLRLGLPEGMVSGMGTAELTVDLMRDRAPRLRLSSALVGVGLAIPALGWSKPAAARGNLTVAATLGTPPKVDAISLDASGLSARGAIALRPDGALDRAAFSSVRLKGWLDAPVTITGRGAGASPGIAVNGGSVDLRRLTTGSGGGSDTPPIPIALDRLTISDSIALTRFRGTLDPGRAGMAGDFTGLVNGKVGVAGTLNPTPQGAQVRIRSGDAGGVLSAAGIFPNARGGTMDLTLDPLGPPGTYDGTLGLRDIRIRNAPALAELVNAISVVGLLDQLQASGLLFSEVEAQFRLTPQAVRIVQGSAVGASLGVSAEGVYRFAGSVLDLQGVVSPIYFLNGIGSVLTRKGEGLFGFNYTVKGSASNPSVSVNPLSILTPGMFRDIFRAPPPASR